MGLFDIFKSKAKRRLPDIGNTEPICPYCGHQLDKMPGRKKKCPACAEHILVRTRPSDRMKILIREDQAFHIEEQWAIANGTHDQFLAERKAYETERNRLQAQFGREPSENDIKWAQLNNELLEYANQFQWGLYRNACLSMGDLLKKEGRNQHALDKYLEVCYLDVNGPNNCGSRNPQVLREFPPFNPKDGMLVPTVIGYIEDMLERQELSKDDAHSRFLEIATKAQRALNLPVAPDNAWEKLALQLS